MCAFYACRECSPILGYKSKKGGEQVRLCSYTMYESIPFNNQLWYPGDLKVTSKRERSLSSTDTGTPSNLIPWRIALDIFRNVHYLFGFYAGSITNPSLNWGLSPPDSLIQGLVG